MFDPKDSPLFEAHADPESGVVSHLLARKVAPLQQSFYFVNDGFGAGGRLLWFACAFPPSGAMRNGRTLGVADLERGEVRHFPDTQFSAASPWVDPESGSAYWCSDNAIWRRGRDPDEPVEFVNALPEDLTGERNVERLATHLTRSADGKRFFVDASFGLQYVFGTLPLDGGDFEFWARFDRHYNHVQFSPTDPERIIFSQENHVDPITGLRLPIVDRLWTMTRGGAPRPIMPEPIRLTHEWWDPDGRHVWCLDPGKALWRVDLETGEFEEKDRRALMWHAHADRSGRFAVCDTKTDPERQARGCPSAVWFTDLETGRSVRVADNPEMVGKTGRSYHIDPHPRFCLDDRYVVHTTTVRGEVDLAVVSFDDLKDRVG